jgi:methyl-accepting chemotaxis protein
MQAGTQKLEQEVQASSQTGNALKQIATQSELLREMTTHIAGAASGQSSATQRMNQNLEQINTLFKESELGTQQAAKACLELSDLALDLDKTVRNFKLDRDRKAAVPSRPENPTPAEKSPGRAHAVGVH